MTHPRIVHDAKEMAGCFYELERSDVFRITWPSQDEYVRIKWPHFVSGVRQAYAELLGAPNVAEDEKERMYEALVGNYGQVVSDGASSPLQLVKNTESFVGSRRENHIIREKIGPQARSIRERLRTTSALFQG